MSWAIRRARREENETISALVNSAYRGESSRAGWTTEADLLGGQRTDPAAVDAMLADPAGVILVAEEPGPGLVGVIHLERRSPNLAYLGMLTVHPQRQGRGLGREMLRRAEEHAHEEWGAEALEMTVISVRSELIDWYRRCGYKPTGETRPFPMTDPRFGLPRVPRLEFMVLRKEQSRRAV